MNILFLMDSLGRGGAEVLALDVCRNARANDLRLTFAALGGGALEADFRASGVDFVRLARRLPVDPLVIGRLRRLIKDERIAVVHAHQAVDALHGYLAALGTGARVALSHHGFVADRKNYQTLKFLIPRVGVNIYVSESLRQWYKTEARLDADRNYAVVLNGVDEKRLAARGKNFKAALKLSDKAPLFGMISNFYAAPRKDQATLCRAFARVAARLPEARLALVGKTEAGAESKFDECVRIVEESALTDRVHFLGARTDVPDILAALDVFVLSSLHEGLPIAAIEAMLARRPCVFSDIEPLREISGDGRFAEIFPTGDAGALAEKLLKLGEDKTFREELAARAYDYAQAHFSIEAHIANLKRVYERVVSNSKFRIPDQSGAGKKISE